MGAFRLETVMYSVLVVNEKWTQGIQQDKRYREFNRVFEERLDVMIKNDECVDHAGFQERKATVAESKQFRITEFSILYSLYLLSRVFRIREEFFLSHAFSL